MKKKLSVKVEKYINNSSQVTLFYFNERINCQILKQSKELLLIKDIKDWHYDAFMIIPKKYIKKIKYTKIDRCREKILKPLKKEDYINEISKINLKSIKAALESLLTIEKGVCIENAKEKEYIFLVGEIKKLSKRKVYIREIDLCGRFIKKIYKMKYSKITSIFYDDEYSKKLLEYARKKI